MEANRAAFGYARVAALFFVSLLVTWVPSSLNRVNSLIHPGSVNVGFAYAGSIVLSLMGFWNSVIYMVTSREACRKLFASIGARFKGVKGGNGGGGEGMKEFGRERSQCMGRGAYGESLEGLAGGRQSVSPV